MLRRPLELKEVIVVLDCTDADFGLLITELRDQLHGRLPVTVSFSYALLRQEQLPAGINGAVWMQEWMAHVIGAVDRKLFGLKRARRDEGKDVQFGFIAETTVC